MAVDVVVVNYKTDQMLAEFIESYKQHSFEGCTLTVVDVESPFVESMTYGNVWFTEFNERPNEHYSVYRFAENVGYARACNRGAELGTNDVVLLANADTQLSAGFKECHDALMDHDDWGVLGPRQVNEQGRITAGGIFGSETYISQRGWDERDYGQYSDVRDDAKSVSGALYFIKRKVWQELTDCPFMQKEYPGITGAFIPTPHYYEETCCSYHARAHGYKIVFYGPVQMLHHWHKAHPIGSWADQQAEYSKLLMRGFLGSHGIECE